MCEIEVGLYTISRLDMSCAQAQWVRSKPKFRVMQLKLHEPTMAIGYSLRMCARHVDSTNPGRSSLVFRSKLIPEAEMSNRLIVGPTCVYDTMFYGLMQRLSGRPKCLLVTSLVMHVCAFSKTSL